MAAEDRPSGQSRHRRGESGGEIAKPLREFLSTETGSGGILLVATIVALVWANSPLSSAYESLWDTRIAIRVGSEGISMDLQHWVNDGLMALFFFVVGLEVRREFSIGALTERRRVALPAIAALGGLVVPALLFLAINPGGDESRGWGIVIGTDTAFLLATLALVGPACPTQLRVFLLTLTIFDDIAAISLIGIVYSDSIDLVALAAAAGSLAAIILLDRFGAWRAWVYILVGGALWVATFESGLHATIAGMVTGLAIGAYMPRRDEVENAASLFRAFRQSPGPDVGYAAVRGLRQAVSVNERFQEVLHPISSYLIVPIFALANAGVDLRGGVLGDALVSPLTWGVVLGLVAGKLIGIGAGALGTVRVGLGTLPAGVGSGQILGGAALSGIGFTVSLLIAGLAFDSQELVDEATVGIIIAGVLSALLGWIVFRLAAALRGERTASLPMALDPPVRPDRDHVQGSVDAPLTLVEYGDYECPFCSRATGVVHELQDRFGDELRYVFRHLPLDDVHPHAELAAVAAEAAAEQGRFWDAHEMFFDHTDQLEYEDLVGYAAELGLDVERFVRDLEDERLAERVRADAESAEASGARATPTFFIGGRRHLGPYDTESLSRELEESRRLRTG